MAWLAHRDQILDHWGLDRHFGRGYSVSVFRPTGTGKNFNRFLIG